jgi:hypothetical protein
MKVKAATGEKRVPTARFKNLNFGDVFTPGVGLDPSNTCIKVGIKGEAFAVLLTTGGIWAMSPDTVIELQYPEAYVELGEAVRH